MLKPKLLQTEYYLSKLTMFMRQSYGIEDHFRILIGLLQWLDKVQDGIFNVLDIYDLQNGTGSNIQTINNVGIGSSSTDAEKLTAEETNEILDFIGDLVGVKREFDVSFVNDDDEIEKHAIKLSNFRFLRLIKTQIIQNNFIGTREQAEQLYSMIGLPVLLLNGRSSLSVDVMLDINNLQNTEDEQDSNGNIIQFNLIDKYLYSAGLYTIKSMGIVYSQSSVSFAIVGLWDNENEGHGWNQVVFAA